MRRSRIKKLIFTNLTLIILLVAAEMVFVGLSTKSYADPVYQATCTISNVPSVLSIGSSMTPKMTVTNTGTGTIKPHMISMVDITNGPTTYFKDKGFGSIASGHSKTLKLGKFTAQPTTPITAASVFSHSDLNYVGTKVFFDCYRVFSFTP